MKINFQYTNFKADQKLLDFITKKITKLETFYDRIIDASVYLKVEKVIDKDNKLVEVKLNVANNVIFAEQKSRTFEAATDLLIEALKSQLIKYKERAQ